MQYAGIDLGPHSAEYRIADQERRTFSISLLRLDVFLEQANLSSRDAELVEMVSQSIMKAFNGFIEFSPNLIEGKLLSATYRHYHNPFNGSKEFEGSCETSFQFIFDLKEECVYAVVYHGDEFYDIDFPVRPSVLLRKLPDSKKFNDKNELDAYLRNELLPLLPSNTLFVHSKGV